MRGDFILLLNHMYNRQKCFQTASLRCRSSIRGSSLAEKISLLNVEDLNLAILQKQTGQTATGTAGDYLKTVTTSCRPVGYTPESAKLHRRQHFALDDFFQTHNNSLNFDGSVEIHFPKSLGLIPRTIFNNLT